MVCASLVMVCVSLVMVCASLAMVHLLVSILTQIFQSCFHCC